MGLKDITEKRLEDYADVFADIVNVLLFDGDEVIKPTDLQDALPKSIYKADGKIHEQERDVAKRWIAENVAIAFIGLENQTDIFKEMPLRTMSYDAAVYRNILNEMDDAARNGKKKPSLYPAITLVLYFGEKRWNKPKTLKEIVPIPERFEPFVNDYHINLFEISFLPDSTVKKFKSDFRYVADYFTQARKMSDGEQKRINMTRFEIQHAVETLELMKVVTGDNRFEEIINEQVKGGKIDMFSVFDAYEERGEKRGEQIGLSKGLHSQIKVLKKLLPDFAAVRDSIRETKDFDIFSDEEIKKFYNKV